MAINDRLESIALHLGNAYAKVSSKGGTVPANRNLENLANAIDSITGGSPVVGDVQLNAPSLSLGTSTTTSDPLIITNAYNGNFVNTYDIYEGSTLLTSISASLTSNTINLRDYISTGGAHTIKVVAKGTSMLDSNPATITYRQSTYMTITNNLVNCTTDNDATTSTVNASYSATLTADSGYSFAGATVSIIMDGVDVTSSVYDKGVITIASITGDIIINATFAVITQLATPNISLSGDILTIFAVPNAEMYVLCLNNAEWQELDSLTVDLTALLTLNGTYSVSVKAKADGYLDSNNSNAISYVVTNGENPDPVLENNSWSTIRLVCESGQANTYWSVGDTKTDLGTDGNTRTFRIVDMQGLYNKHVVFEEVECEYAGNNLSGDEMYSWNYPYDETFINNDFLPRILQKFSSVLANNITQTTIGIPYQGNLAKTVTTKLFLAAATEIYLSGESDERSLIVYEYYRNASNADRIKYSLFDNQQNAKDYWTRTLHRTSWSNNGYVKVTQSGGKTITYPNARAYESPCFAF